MGTTQAMGMAEAVADGDISLEHALGYHLTVNHFPPVPAEMIPACIEAIELANEGDWDAEVTLPEDVTWRGQFAAPVHAIVESHHLEAFLDQEDEWGDGEEG